MVTVYESLVGASFIRRSVPFSPKWPESPPVPIPYTGFCRSRNEFCADMLPTTPGASLWSIDVLFSTMCQLPRF